MAANATIRSALLSALVAYGSAGMVFAGEARDKSDRTSEWSFEISGGIKHDSNLSVIEADILTQSDDIAAVIQLSVDYLTKLGPRTMVKLGYDFDQSLYFDFDEFNVQSHTGSAKLRHKFSTEPDASDVALTYRYIYMTLGGDGDGFMNQHRLSPTFGVYIAKPIYLLFEYIYADKDFIDEDGRDAMVHSGGTDLYYFIDGSKFMVIAGYRYDDSNAEDVDFDYAAHNGKIRVVKRFNVAGTVPKLSVAWEHESRNYSSPTSAGAEQREDDRDKYRASLEVPIDDTFFVVMEYQYRDFGSNLPEADYSENLAEMRVGAEF